MRYPLISAAILLAFTANAVAETKPEYAVKWRQAGYSFMSWNMSRIRGNLEGTFNKDEVQKAANTIKAIANSGMVTLYLPGTDGNNSLYQSHARPDIWTDREKFTKAAAVLIKEADELAIIAEKGDTSAIQDQLGRVGGACKACHEDFKFKN